jgi:hypothetical protein
MARFSAGQVMTFETQTRMSGIEHHIPAAAKQSKTYWGTCFVVPMIAAKQTAETSPHAAR